MAIGPLNATGIKPETFFNLKGLSAERVAKLENSVKESRETLALADRLQTMRDNAKSLHKLEMSFKAALKGKFFDFYS